MFSVEQLLLFFFMQLLNIAEIICHIQRFGSMPGDGYLLQDLLHSQALKPAERSLSKVVDFIVIVKYYS